MTRLTEALESERKHAEQWREVAEDRRVALEKLRQHPLVRLLFRIAQVLLPPLRRAARRAGRATREAKRVAGGVQGLPHRLDAGRREQALHRALAALPEPPRDTRRVSLIVLTRDGRDNLARLLPALRRHTVHENREILVLDNGSGPDTRAFLDAQDDVRVIRSETNLSFSEANNRAAAEATGDVLCFCNDDLEPVSHGWLSRMLAALDDDVVAVGAQLLYPRRSLLGGATRDLGVQHAGIEFVPAAGAVPRASNIGAGRDPEVVAGTREVAAATAACLCVDRAAFDAVGGFDPRYVYGAEDVDLCWALRREGGRVVVATDAVLLHHEGATRHREDPAVLNRRQAANWDAFAAKHGPALTRAVALDRLTARHVLASTPYRVAITITRDLQDAGYGDWYTAHELGEALGRLGWEITYVERYRDAWYDLPDGLDAVVVLLDTFDLRRVEVDGTTTIAWVRNWTERWTSHPWFDDYDVVLASSRTSADLIAADSRHEPVVFPLATNPARFRLGEGERRGAVFTGNYWGRDTRLDDLVAAVPELAVYGKGWDEVPAVASAWHGSVPYDALAGVYASSSVVVDQAADHTRAYGSLNSRVFDALAAGALPVTNQVVGATELFGDDLPTYDSPEALADLVQRLLAEPDTTAERARRLREEVLDAHTYDARARALRDLLVARVERPSFALATSVPDADAAPRWGDWHLAEALARELRAAGHPTSVLLADEWESRRARSHDVFVHCKGRSVAPRAEGQVHVVWNISHPEELTVEECDAADLVLVASHTGFDEELRRRTDTPVAVMLQATDERRFRPRQPDPAHVDDVVFVGNSRFVMRAVIRDALAAGLHPVVYGANWEKFIDPSLVRATHVRNEDLPVVYSSARVLLNDHWAGMRTHGYASNRLFDAVACGAVVVSDEVPGLEELFAGAVVTYRTPDDLRLAVEELLSDPDGRRDRGQRGRAAVLSGHTFAHRAHELLTAVAPLVDAKQPPTPAARQTG